MAERTIIQHADGTATEICDSYALFGTIDVGPPVKAEDPTRYQSRTVTEAELLKRRGWTPEQLETALGFLGHPQGEPRQSPKFSFRMKCWRVWRETDLERWEQHYRSLKFK